MKIIFQKFSNITAISSINSRHILLKKIPGLLNRENKLQQMVFLNKNAQKKFISVRSNHFFLNKNIEILI